MQDTADVDDRSTILHVRSSSSDILLATFSWGLFRAAASMGSGAGKQKKYEVLVLRPWMVMLGLHGDNGK